MTGLADTWPFLTVPLFFLGGSLLMRRTLIAHKKLAGEPVAHLNSSDRRYRISRHFRRHGTFASADQRPGQHNKHHCYSVWLEPCSAWALPFSWIVQRLNV